MRFVAIGSVGFLAALALLSAASCAGGVTSFAANTSVTSETSPMGISVTIDPGAVTLAPGGSIKFKGRVNGSLSGYLLWNCSAGSIDQTGKYTAPNVDGSYFVSLTASVDPSVAAISQVTVSGGTATTGSG